MSEITEITSRLKALKEEFRKLESEHTKLSNARKKAKLALLASIKGDLGSECDSDHCHTEKRNEAISKGETDTSAHDDADRGRVTISCLDGQIEVIVSAAVWDSFDVIDRKKLSKGDVWNRDIPEQSSWFDQTNRVEIIGLEDSHYNLDFESWDD